MGRDWDLVRGIFTRKSTFFLMSATAVASWSIVYQSLDCLKLIEEAADPLLTWEMILLWICVAALIKLATI